MLNKSKTGYIRIDGSTPAQKREGLVKQFQEREDVRVAVLGIQAAGVGLTLTSASLVVFAELSWVPGEILQVSAGGAGASLAVHQNGRALASCSQQAAALGRVAALLADPL